jgi:hypothetical protein
MNENDELLGFLLEGLNGRQRDLVARAFYLYAQGDPASAPVNEATLLIACSRRVSQAPNELRDVCVDFRKLLEKGRDMEARIRERVELSNAGVVADFKDETRRAQETWRETFRYAKAATEGAEETSKAMQPVLKETRMLATDVALLRQDLALLREELQRNDESHRKTAESANKIETAYQGVQKIVSHLTKEVRANWLTIGFLGGIPVISTALRLPWWEGLPLLAATVCLIQWLLRQSWDFVRRWIEKGKAFLAKPKSAA